MSILFLLLEKNLFKQNQTKKPPDLTRSISFGIDWFLIQLVFVLRSITIEAQQNNHPKKSRTFTALKETNRKLQNIPLVFTINVMQYLFPGYT